MTEYSQQSYDPRPPFGGRIIQRLTAKLPPIVSNGENWQTTSSIEATREHWLVSLSMASFLGMLTALVILWSESITPLVTSPAMVFAWVLGVLTGNEAVEEWANIILFSVIMTFIIVVVSQSWAAPSKKDSSETEPVNVFRDVMLTEEKVFRAGAEHWSVRDKVKSAAIFALVHLFNLIVPIITLGFIFILGMQLTYVYQYAFNKMGSRAKALQHTSAVHQCFNTITIVGLLSYFLGLIIHRIALTLL